MRLTTQKDRIDLLFQNVSHLYETEILELYDEAELAASICIEYIDTVCNVHLYVHDAYRTEAGIKTIIKEIHSKAVPHVKSRGIKSIVATCAAEDEKTIWLMKQTGFELKKVVIGEISWE